MEPIKKQTRLASVNIKDLAVQMERLALIESAIKKVPVDQSFLENAKLTGLGIFRLVVMGEIKKGKSSFINALTGTENLVPVHSDVATSTIFKIHYGPEVKYTVYFNKDANSPAKKNLTIEAAQVKEYGTEDGNPDNIKNVDFIRVESPASILQNGLVIVDTPGVGGLFKKHREITFRHAPKADAVFFITDSVDTPIGADEVKFLKELRQVTPFITFIQTKSSKVDGPARMARMENNLGILEEAVGLSKEEITYFIVDSKTKLEADKNRDIGDLEISGFGPLVSYLTNKLRTSQESLVARAALKRADSKLLPLEGELKQQKAILDADTTEKRQALDQEFSECQTRLMEWDKTTKPLILEAFRKALTQLPRVADENFRDLQVGGKIQSEFEQTINQAENVEQVKLLLAQIVSDLASLTSLACLKFSEKARSRVENLFKSLAKDVCSTIEGNPQLSLLSIDQDKLWVNTVAIDRAMDRVLDQPGTGTIIEGMGKKTPLVFFAGTLGGLLGSFIPGIGNALGAAAATAIALAWVGKEAIQNVKPQQLEGYKREALGALQQALLSSHQSAIKEVNNFISDIQAEASSFLQKFIQQSNDHQLKLRGDLQQRQKATQLEILESQTILVSINSQLDTVKKALESFKKMLDSSHR
jgi:Dynamin family